MVKPEDTLEMEGDLSTSKSALSNNLVPTNKNSRKVYGAIISNRHTAAQTITLTMEEDTTVKRTIPPIMVDTNVTIDISRPLDSPIFTMPPGQNIKGVASAGPASVILQAYDVE